MKELVERVKKNPTPFIQISDTGFIRGSAITAIRIDEDIDDVQVRLERGDWYTVAEGYRKAFLTNQSIWHQLEE